MHGGRALELGRRDRDGSWGSTVHGGSALGCDEGTVMAVKEHGAWWKCAGAGMKGPLWSLEEHGARWKCAGAGMKGP